MMKNRVMKQTKREARRDRTRGKANLTIVSDSSVEDQQPLRPANKSPIVPRNANQARYINSINERMITIGVGDAGCGKTFLVTSLAADMLRNKEIERIVVTRPVLQADEDLGFLPGDINEKFAPYFRPVHEVLLERLGGGFLEYCLRPTVEKIVISPFAYLRGNTFKNCVVILDEAQNTTVNQMKLFLTRIGEGARVIINGDVTQCDLPKGMKSGLADLLERIQDDELIDVTVFEEADSVRSDVCSYALKIYR